MFASGPRVNLWWALAMPRNQTSGLPCSSRILRPISHIGTFTQMRLQMGLVFTGIIRMCDSKAP